MSRITNRLGWGVAGALGIALLATLAGVIYAGPLSPPGAPSATGPTQIFSLPYTISSGGTYIVQANLTCTSCTSGQNGITISASDVSIDLNGFAIIGVVGSGKGIFAPSSPSNLSIHDGTVRSWGAAGIGVDTSFNSQFENLQLYGNGGDGLTVGGVFVGDTVRGVVATSNGGSGINAGIAATISDCAATYNAGSGIRIDGASVVSNCSSQGNTGAGIEIHTYGNTKGTLVSKNAVSGNGDGIDVTGVGSTVADNSVSGNTLDGIKVIGDLNTIKGNTVSGNRTNGIEVGGAGNNIAENTVSGNNTATGSLAAINVLAGANRNRIDSNYIEANSASHAVEVDGTLNTITRNTGGNSTAGVFNFAGAGNTFGPVQLQATPLTNPWANIVY